MGNPLEEAAEHIAHAGHDHGGGHGGGGGADHEAHSRLGTYIGITMAVLGVLLAYCAAKVGAERTELIQALVEQQHAHAKYQAQDVKHRMAVNNLRQLHSEIPSAELGQHLDADLEKIDKEATPAAAPPTAAAPEAALKADAAVYVTATTRSARALGHSVVEGLTPNKTDAALLADTVERYYHETQAANAWVESFNPAIRAHVGAQERFELAQLLAEIGIVVASVGLLIKRRAPWFIALALGASAIGYVITTYASTGAVVREAEVKIEETGKEYREMRERDKTTEVDNALVAEVRAWAGKSAAPKAAPEHHGAAKEAKPE
jgi:Domain of unknown function (DUF4337)